MYGRDCVITSMMNHNHRAHTHKAVKHDHAPQSVSRGAASGVADDGGFCGWLVV